MSDAPAIQLIANLVVVNSAGEVLLAKYYPGGESDEADADERWWLPAHELDPYQHPDDAANLAIEAIGGIEATSVTLAKVQSFRGRRGWHVSFDYHIEAAGEPSDAGVPAGWHNRQNLPPTMHGNWERDTIDSVLGPE